MFATEFFFATSESSIDIWFGRMVSASWQGGLLLILAWMICRWWKQLSASTRCWVWRLAYLKFALVLCLGCFLDLPVIPEGILGNKPVANRVDDEIAFANGAQHQKSTAELNAQTIPHVSQTTQIDGLRSSETNSNSSQPVLQFLFVAWITGAAVSLALVGRQYLKVRKILRHCTAIKHQAFLNHYRSLCHKFGSSNPPRIALSQSIRSPMLVGVFKPVILIPASVVDTCELEEIEMIISHELAHAKRRDLMWNWLPIIVRSLFFFHPLVWLFQSNYAIEQEVACDFLALRNGKTENADYGNLLIKIAASQPKNHMPTLGTIGVASSFVSLKKRILEMSRFEFHQSCFSNRLSIAVLAAAVFAASPINLVAQKNEKENKPQERIEKEKTATGSGALEKTTKKTSDTGKPGSPKVGARKMVRRPSLEPASKNPGNLNISVNEGQKTESMRIFNKRNGAVEVTYSIEENGKKNISKFVLDDFKKLREKNKDAYAFYKKHVEEDQVGASTSSSGGLGKTNSLKRKGRNPRQFAEAKAGQSGSSSSQSSSSSAWESSSSISKNGVTRSSRKSGTTGGGIVGGGSKQMMIDQINKMINETDDPNLKATLQKMLDQVKNPK